MDNNRLEKQLIDRYLFGQLTGQELEDFNQRLKSDSSFKQEVEFHSLIQSGITFSYDQDLQRKISTLIRYKKALIPSGLKLILIFIIVMVSVSLLWFYLTPDTGFKSQDFSFFSGFKKSKPIKAKSGKSKSDLEYSELLKDRDLEKVNSDSLNKADVNLIAGEDSLTTGVTESVNEDIEVKKDQLLIALSVPVFNCDESTELNSKSNLTESASEKLNPEAGLPGLEEEIKQQLNVEFWLSPVNYRGYKFGNNRLVLFGVEEPDQVRLYHFKDDLYMSLQGYYYKLTPISEFGSYTRIKDNEVPLVVRSKK
jgi:hypothetical protein